MCKLLIAGFATILSLAVTAAPPTPATKTPGGRPQGQTVTKPSVARKPAAAAKKSAPRPASRPASRPAAAKGGVAPRHEDHGDHERMSRTDWKLERIAQLEERGKAAAAQIAAFIGDTNEDVSEEAYTVWSGMLEEMDPAWRARAIVQAAQAIQAVGHGGPAMPPPMVPVQQPVLQPVVVPQQVVVPQVQ